MPTPTGILLLRHLAVWLSWLSLSANYSSVLAGEGAVVWKQTRVLAAPEADQAAAADEEFLYAISGTKVAKYHRESGKRVAVSSGSATHLNSGTFWEGRLYCAHSNYPNKPEQSEIKVLDPETMRLSTFKDFGKSDGSLTWVVRHGGQWWCNFAFYGEENSKTYLARLDDQWRETGRWTYPAVVVRELGKFSVSGGIWEGEDLLVTDHDNRVLYRLRLPKDGSVLEFLVKEIAPCTGQGIAADPKTGGIVGIDRGKHLIVLVNAPSDRSKESK
jgi:hypothetical protein